MQIIFQNFSVPSFFSDPHDPGGLFLFRQQTAAQVPLLFYICIHAYIAHRSKKNSECEDTEPIACYLLLHNDGLAVEFKKLGL